MALERGQLGWCWLVLSQLRAVTKCSVSLPTPCPVLTLLPPGVGSHHRSVKSRSGTMATEWNLSFLLSQLSPLPSVQPAPVLGAGSGSRPMVVTGPQPCRRAGWEASVLPKG